jgi:hypothetical protein
MTVFGHGGGEAARPLCVRRPKAASFMRSGFRPEFDMPHPSNKLSLCFLLLGLQTHVVSWKLFLVREFLFGKAMPSPFHQ